MKNRYTAIVKQDGIWWIGWIEEVPGVNCQERTREELLAKLRLKPTRLRTGFLAELLDSGFLMLDPG